MAGEPRDLAGPGPGDYAELEGVLPRGEFYGRVDPGGRLVLAAETPLIFRKPIC